MTLATSPRPFRHRRARLLSLLGAVLAVGISLGAQQSQPATATRANSYDDAWESFWIAHARQLLSGAAKTDGFVLQIGDSITHSRAYGSWASTPTGATAGDLAALQWARAGTWGAGQQDVDNRNGWYLAGADTTAWRGMTALSGGSLTELLFGCCNGDGPAMPANATPAEARAIVADPTYTSNLHIDTLLAAFHDAQFAVLMLGTNDPANPQNLPYLTSIVDKLEALRIVPILSTIPPRSGAEPDVVQLNAGIVQLAQSRALPLIDFYQEVLLRRPGTTWFGTLISSDGVHPTGDNGGFTVISNPYLPGGNPATQLTGDALLNVGYLLRNWLTVQKLAEVKRQVVDVNQAPTATITAPAPGQSYAAPATLTIAVEAGDPDGSVSRVDFYGNGTLIGSDASSPYEFVWTGVTAGSYAITARAVDDLGAAGDSSAVTITVAQPAMHVGDLDAAGTRVAKQAWRATVSVTVHAGGEALLPQAVVTGTWSRAASGSASCTTNAAGLCSVSTGNLNTKKGVATFTVTSVSRPGYGYRALDNHDVDGGSDGRSVTAAPPQ